MERLPRAARDEHHRRRPSHLGRRHRRGQDGEGRAAHRQVGVGNRPALHRRVRRRHEARSTSRTRRCCAARPTTSPSRSRSSPTSRRTASRTGPPTASTSTRRSSRTTATSRASTSRDRRPASASTSAKRGTRPISRCGSSRRPAKQRQMEWDSPWGKGFPGLAHRVLGDGAEVSRRLLRHPLRRRRPHSRPPHERDRADRGARRHAARELLAARLLPAVERREDGEVGRRVPAHRIISSSAATIRSPIAICASPRTIAASSISRGTRSMRRPSRSSACARRLRAARRRTQAPPDAALTERFTNEINDDLNLPRALAVAWETLRGDLAAGRQARDAARVSTRSSGCGSRNGRPTKETVPDAVTALAEARLAARRAKNVGRSRSAARRVARGGLGDGRPSRRLRAEAEVDVRGSTPSHEALHE